MKPNKDLVQKHELRLRSLICSASLAIRPRLILESYLSGDDRIYLITSVNLSIDYQQFLPYSKLNRTLMIG